MLLVLLLFLSVFSVKCQNIKRRITDYRITSEQIRDGLQYTSKNITELRDMAHRMEITMIGDPGSKTIKPLRLELRKLINEIGSFIPNQGFWDRNYRIISRYEMNSVMDHHRDYTRLFINLDLLHSLFLTAKEDLAMLSIEDDGIIPLGHLPEVDHLIVIYAPKNQHVWVAYYNIPKKIAFTVDSIRSFAADNQDVFTPKMLYRIAQSVNATANRNANAQILINGMETYFNDWKFIITPNHQQSRGSACGYYSLINSLYLAQRIIPRYNDEDIEDLRHFLFHELKSNNRFNFTEEQPVSLVKKFFSKLTIKKG
ncbi:hypothetical protein SNEBB_003184 [Seison nebaliae]|nr:hypothetical protein SNEBB_003184 [Seison nebaliae]